MNKQNLYTGICIAFSFFIAIGGWVLTSTLIDKKSDALLEVKGITYINVPPLVEEADSTTIGDASIEKITQKRPILTEAEIAKILPNWASSGRIYPHEPTEGQLNMEEAIAIGKAGLMYLNEQDVIPIEPLEYKNDKINAYLYQKYEYEGDDPLYSYWTVSFRGERLNASIIINAVTGQIWKVDVTVFNTNIDLNKVDIETALNTFTSYIGLTTVEKLSVSLEKNNISASKSLSSNKLFAFIRMKTFTAENTRTLLDINIFLSTYHTFNDTVEVYKE